MKALPVLDQRSRPLRDLRISVTDRCNFRCNYCMPKAVYGPNFRFLPKPQVLSFEEITRLATLFVELGVKKLRLTGGEPLLRSELPVLVGMLAKLNADLALTTNGSLLAKRAASLAAAGLSRVTVSLDSLDEAAFRSLNDVDFPVTAVLDGIDAAQAAGLSVKINCVVRRGFNADSIVGLAERFRGTGHTLRFIEFMDVGITNGWRLDEVVTADEIVARIGQRFELEPLAAHYPGEVARRFRYRDGQGEIGVIASVTQPFCSECSRARLSADGHLYTCLFSNHGTDLREPMRSGASDTDLRALFEDLWRRRTDRYSELRSSKTRQLGRVEMSYIGG